MKQHPAPVYWTPVFCCVGATTHSKHSGAGKQNYTDVYVQNLTVIEELSNLIGAGLIIHLRGALTIQPVTGVFLLTIIFTFKSELWTLDRSKQ